MTQENKDYDPYAITPEEIQRQKAQFATRNMGLICPKKNASIKGVCHVCNYIESQIGYDRYPDEHAATIWRRKHQAKVNWFMNIVEPHNINISKILEIGKNAGNTIQFATEKKGWGGWIANPKAGRGREIEISKFKGEDNYNKYDPTPSLEVANYDIPEEVLNNLPNLDNIISMIKNEELNDDNHIKISSIKEGETLKFRVCPGSKSSSNPLMFMIPVARHWGVSQEQIDGVAPISWEISEEKSEGEAVWSPTPKTEDSQESTSPQQPTTQPAKQEEPVKQAPVENAVKRQKCFGLEVMFDPQDDQCKACSDIKECGDKVRGNQKNEDIPY